MRKRVAILQSNYIPWKGYFDVIHDVDEFIFLDDVQYTKHDWRNRNVIKTAAGPAWLTIPVGRRQSRRICDVLLPRNGWQKSHWQRIEEAYRDAPFFTTYAHLVRELYARDFTLLSDLNQTFIRTIACDVLDLHTRFGDSRSFGIRTTGQQRVLDLLAASGADVYVSGPAAKSYLDPAAFDAAGIELIWKDYGGYPDYPQSSPPFLHNVTILDLLFHTGGDASHYIWGWRARGSPPR